MSTKSVQHVSAPLGIKMLNGRRRRGDSFSSSLAVRRGFCSTPWFGQQLKCALLQGSGSGQGFRMSVFPKVTPVLQPWCLKWVFWAGFRPLSSHPVTSVTLVAWGTFLACSPSVCSVPGEAFVAHARFPHSTSKGSWARRQLGFPSLGSVHKAELTTRLQNYQILHLLRLPLSTVPGQSTPEGLGKCWSCSCTSACHSSYKEFKL